MISAYTREHWNGPHWRFWAFISGIGMVGAATLAAWISSSIAEQPFTALLSIGLLAEMLVLSMMGSGMLTATSRRMSRGGLARETATLDIDSQSAERSELGQARYNAARDRRTTRAGIILLPSLLTFIYLLAR